ncbi:hypothetical protein [Paraburkholderia oxyphila]|uniref:hypothetical protein n=1 Tax=Paraburkholderia oxyphila TaxID=614212 RepID=UPI000489FCCC|nr:hypothetical protein [Paraburkholderia oxyphila]
MFGLYPAGPDWVQHFDPTSTARNIQQLLVKHAGFTAGLFHQPYGDARGTVIAVRRNFVVMCAELEADTPELVVAPDVALTNLLWSHSSGYASQWSPRELKALTGCNSWDMLLNCAGTWYREACSAVERAIDGTIVPAAPPPVDPVIATPLPDDDDAPWLPPDYMHDAPIGEGMPCDR